MESMQFADEKGKIFVGGLSWDTSHASMLKYFSRYGEVIDCVVMKNPATGKSRGFGFVTFKDPSCVETVLSSGPHVLDGRQIDPKACNPRSMNKQGGKNAENLRKKIFIGGLPVNCNEEMLKEHFTKYGEVADVVIMYDQQKQRSRGFGFLTFESEDSVDRVVQDHFIHINGKQVEVKKAEPRDMKAADGTNSSVISTLTNSGLTLMPSPFALNGMSGLGMAAAAAAAGSVGGATYPGMAAAHGFTHPHHSGAGVRLMSPHSPFVTLLVPPGSNYGLAQSPGLQPANIAYAGWPQPGASNPESNNCMGSAYAMGAVNQTGGMTAVSQANSPVPMATGEPMGAEKAGYQLLSHFNTQLGVMGSYPQEASGFGPARGFAVESNGTVSSSPGAQISFTPNVTYTLAQGIPMAGGYGLGASAGMAGASIIAGTYGGQGDATQAAASYMAQASPGMGRIAATGHASAAIAGFHPYRR